MTARFSKRSGLPFPFGNVFTEGGTNFAVFARPADRVLLQIWEAQVVVQELDMEKTGDVWHVWINAESPVTYSYKVIYGKVASPPLLDPYAKKLDVPSSWADFPSYDPKCISSPRPSLPTFKHPRHSKEHLIIYEMHIRGFTQDPSSQVKHPGTFLGVIEKIPHLLSLGVNAVKLLPVFEFDEREVKLKNPETGELLLNYWGYSPVHFFCPMRRYAINDPVAEFREMVHALHHAGIEVILDVVYNHTAEGNEEGPTYHFKALAPSTYYLLDHDNGFLNYSGCGNSVNANNPITYELILDSLRYWALEMGVDGFRFDLASLLTRGDFGAPLSPPPIILAIAKDPLLQGVKLFAEPWDAAGLYQMSEFPRWDSNWSEWNGKFRDQIRAFIKGNPGLKGDFATRICGSQDLYGDFSPTNSLNFITAHDGFTLHDLVSYNHKHNWINGENDSDGSPFNDSWNCGAEGPTENPEILDLRERQMKNFIIALLISSGIPMLLSGDEYAHTKLGNNNTWCQDNFLNWFDWSSLDTSPILPFLKKMIQIRKSLFSRNSFYSPQQIIWHGPQLLTPDWHTDSSFLAFEIPEHDLFCFFNASPSHINFTMPSGSWTPLITSSSPSNNAYASAIFKKILPP